MSAFIPSTAPGAFAANRNTVQTCAATSKQSPSYSKYTMQQDTIPDPTGPATSKYLQFIDADRLNKAPIITINQFKNEQYNSVGMRLAILDANISNGENVKAGVDTFISEDSVPAESKYSKFYDPATIHEAPAIDIYYHGQDSVMRPAVSISQSETPLRVNVAKSILDNYSGNTPLNPKLYPAFTEDRLNKAPVLKFTDPSDDVGRVEIESVNLPLNLYAAELILSKYRS